MKKKLVRVLLLFIAGIAVPIILFFVYVFVNLTPQPAYRGPITDHFDGKKFFNPDGAGLKTFGDLMKWQSSRRPPVWQPRRDVTPKAPAEKLLADPTAIRATFVNHATVLIQVAGLNILTDPIWSERASPVGFAGPKRAHPPGIPFEDLPPIHAVLLSHNHYDHLDLPTLKRLSTAHNPLIICPLGNDLLLEKKKIGNTRAMDWWETTTLGGVEIACVPAQHWSSRSIGDRNNALWGGFVLRGPFGVIYFAGDSGYTHGFKRIAEVSGAPRLALLPIGAYKPEWFMRGYHMSPIEAVLAHKEINAGTSIAIHFGTFPLADDGRDEPAQVLLQALDESDIDRARFRALQPGEALDVPLQ